MLVANNSSVLRGGTSVRRGLVGWWLTDDIGAVGSAVVDYSGLGNHGRLDTGTNSPTISGGIYPSQKHSGPGTSFQWVGGSAANEKCVNVGNASSLIWAQQLSLLCWVY